MESLKLFHQLKEDVLKEYQKAFPFWKGSLQDFGNKEIAQLQDLIEEKTKQRISEKWVYTHLKPENNTKLPREDMLDILSVWVGYSGWDEFKVKSDKNSNEKNKKLAPKVGIYIGLVLVMITVFFVVKFSGNNDLKTSFKIIFHDQYTQKVVDKTNFSVYLIDNNDSLIKQETIENCLELNAELEELKIKVTSPYYKDEVFLIDQTKEKNIIDLQPDDYAMMLLVYMNSNLKDWEKRRAQLEKVILDDAEILEVMNDDIGVEFLNKEEFIDKLTIPLESTKRMEIIDIKYKEKGQIKELKFIQKEKND